MRLFTQFDFIFVVQFIPAKANVFREFISDRPILRLEHGVFGWRNGVRIVEGEEERSRMKHELIVYGIRASIPPECVPLS